MKKLITIAVFSLIIFVGPKGHAQVLNGTDFRQFFYPDEHPREDWIIYPTFIEAPKVNAEATPKYVLYTETYEHRPTFTRNLTKQECEFGKDRALGNPATKEEKEAAKKEAAKKETEEERAKFLAFCKANPKGWYPPNSCEQSACEVNNPFSLTASRFSCLHTVPLNSVVHAECFLAE